MAIDCCWLFLGLLLFLGGWPLHYHCSIILDMGVMISQSHWLGVTCHSKLDIWLTNYCVRHSRWLAGWRCGVTLAPPHWLTLITQISCASPAVVGGGGGDAGWWKPHQSLADSTPPVAADCSGRMLGSQRGIHTTEQYTSVCLLSKIR